VRRPDIGVTGIGLCSSLGFGLPDHWDALRRGHTGHRVHHGLGTAFEGTLAAALLTEAQWADARAHAPGRDPAIGLAAWVARAALDQAGLSTDTLGLVVGTSNGCLHSRRDHRAAGAASSGRQLELLRRSAVDQTAGELARVLDLHGPRITVSTACASSTHALGVAVGWLRERRLPAVMVVGVDVVLPMVAAGFHALGVLGSGPCAPFSLPVGMSLGEGGAAWVLEADPSPRRAQAWIGGYGASADAVHPTAPDPSGRGIARSVAMALADAALGPDDVQLYSAQGTGTEANDAAETLALARVLPQGVPVTSGKGHLGHCQGAGGLLEASLVLGGMRHAALPPTAGFSSARRLAPPDVVSGRPRPAALAVAVKHSAAFGGANASVVLTAEPAPTQAPTPARFGITGTAGLRAHGSTPPDTPARIGRVRLATLDRTARLLVTAVSEALPPHADPTWGLVAGAPGLQASAGTAWQTSVQRGAASGRSFSRLVRNAGTGAACVALRLCGPTATLCAGAGTGLVALLHALDLLSASPGTAGMVVAGSDEVGPNSREREALDPVVREPLVDAAAAVAIERDRGVPITGTGLAGPKALDSAIATALEGNPAPVEGIWSAGDGRQATMAEEVRAIAGAGLADVPLVQTCAGLGHAEATDALVAVAAAVEAVRARRVARALVVATSPAGYAAAICLGPEG